MGIVNGVEPYVGVATCKFCGAAITFCKMFFIDYACGTEIDIDHLPGVITQSDECERRVLTKAKKMRY